MLHKALTVAAAALVLGVYVALLNVMPKQGFWSPDEGAKFIQLHSTESSDAVHPTIAYGAARIDPQFEFYPTRCRHEDLYPVRRPDGSVNFHWPIWFPLATGVLVEALGPTGLYVLPLLSGWIIALLSGYFMRSWDARLAPLAIVAVGLATPIAFFSLTFWEHTPVSLLSLAALSVVMAAPPGRLATLWAIAPLILAAVVLRVELALFGIAVVCGWFAAARWARGVDDTTPPGGRNAWSTSTRVILLVAVMVIAWTISQVIPDRHRWVFTQLPEYLVGGLGKLPYLGSTLTAVFVDTPGNQAPVIADVWRYLMAAACLAVALAPRLRTPRSEALVLFTALAVVLNFSLYLILRPDAYISLHGFLPIAPVMVLGAYAVGPIWRQRRYAQLALAITAAVYTALAMAAFLIFKVGEDGAVPTGLEWGNRYLFTLYPIGIVLALAGLYEYRRSLRPRWLKNAFTAAAVVLLCCGLLLQARGLWMLIESRRAVTSWQTALRGGPPVVTDVWWLPAAMAPLFISQEVQCVRDADDLGQWFALASQHGVERMTYASFRPFRLHGVLPSGFEVATESEEIVSGLRVTRVRFVKHDS